MTLPARYTRVAAILHWLVALLIVINVVLGVWANHAPDEWVRPMIDTHKSIGITVLGLAVLRLLWRLSHPPPKLPETYARWERLAAHGAHLALYVWIFALPITGWLHDSAWKEAATHPLFLFDVVPWFRLGFVEGLDPAVKEPLHTVLGTVHFWFGYLLYGLLALHVAGALKHQWLDRQPELQRINPFAR